MCYMAAIPIAMMAASSLMQVASQTQEAANKNNMLEANAQASLQHAEHTRVEASNARMQADIKAAEERKKTAASLGAQRARMGASGVVVDSGSFLDVQASIAEQGERNAMALLQEGDLQAWRLENQAKQHEAQAGKTAFNGTDPNAVLAQGLLSTGASASKMMI